MTVAVPVGNRLRALRKERGMTIPQLAAATGLTNGFISQLERDLTSASLSSLARIAGALDVRLGHLVDGTPPGEAQATLELRGQEHVLLSAPDEMRFHVTESHIEPLATAGEELYTLPADVEIVSVVEGSLELQVLAHAASAHRRRLVQLLAPRAPHVAEPVGDGARRRPVAGRPESLRAAIIRPACGCSSVG